MFYSLQIKNFFLNISLLRYIKQSTHDVSNFEREFISEESILTPAEDSSPLHDEN